MLSERYIIPTVTIGWPVIMSHGLWKLFFAREGDPNARCSLIAALLTVPALAYPLWTAYNFRFESPPGQNDAVFGYLDLPIAMEAGHDYLPRMHYSAHPERYFHIRDWDTAVKNVNSSIATGDYTHLAALNRHYPFVQSVESNEFLAKYTRFLVWNEPDQKWFEWRVLSDPNYAVRKLGTDRGLMGNPLELYLVEKQENKINRQISPGEVLSHTSESFVWLGWSEPEPTHRWSSGISSTIVFLADPSTKIFDGIINLHAGALGKQRVIILLNGKEIYSNELNNWDENVTIKFPSSWIDKGRNTIEFKLPDARRPENGDSRVLALAIKDIQIK
jgi:hypothetical protein